MSRLRAAALFRGVGSWIGASFFCDAVRTMKDIERFFHTQIEEMPMDIADLI